MTKKQNKFSESFVRALGQFVKNQKREARKQGLDENETKAIISTAFAILGKNSRTFTQKAGLSMAEIK